jgi:hypothetical protein
MHVKNLTLGAGYKEYRCRKSCFYYNYKSEFKYKLLVYMGCAVIFCCYFRILFLRSFLVRNFI